MLIDYHIHSNTSKDSKVEIDEYCRQAVKLGLKEICFTNHHEPIKIEDRSYAHAMDTQKMEKYKRDVDEARKRYPSLTIRLGIELGYKEGWENALKEFVQNHDFDYVMCSLHYIEGKCIVFKNKTQELNDKEKENIIELFFKDMESMARFDFIDCIGHFDGIRRCIHDFNISDYEDRIENIIGLMKKNDIGFEINTAGWRLGFKEQHPNVELLRILKEKEIKKVTVGSDAHMLEQLGYKIPEALALLKDHGFKQVCTFDKRKPIYHDL